MTAGATALALLLLGTTGPARAPEVPPTAPAPFGSFRAGISGAHNPRFVIHPATVAVPAGSHRARNALIGAAIGGVAGIVTCTVISNIAKDAGTGFSTCTTKGYLLFGLSGAALGAGAGALIK